MLSGDEKMKLSDKITCRVQHKCAVVRVPACTHRAVRLKTLRMHDASWQAAQSPSGSVSSSPPPQKLLLQQLQLTSRIHPAGVSHALNQDRTKTPPGALTQSSNQPRSVHKKEAVAAAAQHLRTAFPDSAGTAGCGMMAQHRSSPALVHRK